MEYTGKVHRNPLFWLAKPLLGKFWATGYHGAKASPYLDDEKVRSCRRTKVTPTLAGKSGERHAPLYVGTSTPVTCPAALPRPSGAPARPRLSQAWPGSKRADPRDCRHPDRSRDLEVQARNQALQLERIEQQMGRLRVVHENSIEDSRRLQTEIRSLRRWMMAMAIAIVVLLLATSGMVAFLVAHR